MDFVPGRQGSCHSTEQVTTAILTGNLEWSLDSSPELPPHEHVMTQTRHFVGQNAKCPFEADNSVSLPYFSG